MNTRIYWNLKHLPEDEKPGYLRGLGLSEEQIGDLLLDMQQNSFTYRKETRQPFTESEEWREIQRRIGELTSHEMRNVRGDLPANHANAETLRTLPGGGLGESEGNRNHPVPKLPGPEGNLEA